MTESDNVLAVSEQAHVKVIQLNQPPHNYFDRELLRQIADHLEEGDADRDIRAYVLCSAGKSFCAGAKINPSLSLQEAIEESRAVYAQALRIFKIRKPIVCALQGHVIGGGLGLAMAADFRIATPQAKLAANFTKIGLHPGFALTFTLPEVIGYQKASHLMLTGRTVDGTEALEMGLCDQLVDEAQLQECSLALATSLASNAPLGVQSTRATLRAQWAQRVEDQMRVELAAQQKLFDTADFMEGVQAAAQKRKPRFQGV